MYTGIKQVRAVNGEQFIKDFRKYQQIVIYAQCSKVFMTVRRLEVWELAKREKITYMLSNDIYIVKRTVIVII